MPNLNDLLALQDKLQIRITGNTPTTLLPDDPEEAIKFITWNVLAMTDELHELLNEVGWKPWATSKHVNIEAAQGELVDVFHFFMNLALVLGMNGDDLSNAYLAKRLKNLKRQDEGYDGVSTKCPGCKRALDDEGTSCETRVRALPDGHGKFHGYSQVYCFQQHQYVGEIRPA